MNKEEAIKYLKQLYPNGGHCWLDEQRIEAISMAIKALQKEPVSEDLDEAAENYGIRQGAELKPFAIKYFKAGAKYKEEQFEKCAIKTEVCERITQNGLLPSVTVLVNDCKPNEKVKVIVIKED